MTIHQTLTQSIISTIILGSLLNPISAFAVEPHHSRQLNDIEYPNLDDRFSPCGKVPSEDEINQLPTPKATTIGEVSYISGGSCSDSVLQMKGLAKSFPLEIVLVEKEGNKEVYIADVKVKLIDAKNNSVLDVITDGAFLLVNLPDGQYEIVSEYNLVTQSKHVNIHHKKHERIVFLWANKSNDSGESE